MFPYVNVNDDRVLPRAVALEVTVYPNRKDSLLDNSQFLKTLEDRLSNIIDRPVNAKISRVTTEGEKRVIVLEKLSNVGEELANKIKSSVVECVKLFFVVNGEIEVRFDQLTQRY